MKSKIESKRSCPPCCHEMWSEIQYFSLRRQRTFTTTKTTTTTTTVANIINSLFDRSFVRILTGWSIFVSEMFFKFGSDNHSNLKCHTQNTSLVLLIKSIKFVFPNKVATGWRNNRRRPAVTHGFGLSGLQICLLQWVNLPRTTYCDDSWNIWHWYFIVLAVSWH